MFVPRGMSRETEGLIAGEGARVVTVEGEYDDVAMAARVFAEDGERVGEEEGGAEEAEEKMLCMDVGWDGYEEFPRVSPPTLNLLHLHLNYTPIPLPSETWPTVPQLTPLAVGH